MHSPMMSSKALLVVVCTTTTLLLLAQGAQAFKIYEESAGPSVYATKLGDRAQSKAEFLT